jgi:methyl-accepting chemotaxis protein
MPTRLTLAALLAVLAVTAAGCGKKEQPTATQWANDFCSSVTTWRSSLQTAAGSVNGGNLSKDALQSAADDAQSATDTFVKSVKKLGKPPTKSGDQAQQEINDLSDEIDAGTQTINDAVDNVSGITGVLSAVSTVTGTLSTMGKQVQTTFDSLEKLDPGGELQTAFKQADACKNLNS